MSVGEDTSQLPSTSAEVMEVQKYFRKSHHFIIMFGYLEGGSDLEKLVKCYKKSVASHR